MLCDLRLPPKLKQHLPSSGLLHSVRWFDTDVLGLPISPILKGQMGLIGIQPPYAYHKISQTRPRFEVKGSYE